MKTTFNYSILRMKTTYNDAIVFVVGGGNYIEYQNLRDYVKAKNTGTIQFRTRLFVYFVPLKTCQFM